MDGTSFRMSVAGFFFFIGGAGSLLSSGVARAAGLLAQAAPSGQEQFAQSIPMLLFICTGLGAVIGALVAVAKIAWSLYTSAKEAVTAIAHEAVTKALASERSLHANDLGAIREDLARLRGEITTIRRFVMHDAGASPPPVEPRG